MPKKKRPDVLKGNTYKCITGCGSLFLRVNHDKGDIIETMAQMGKAGNCANAWLEAMCLIVSETFKFEGITNTEKEDIAKCMCGVYCPNGFNFDGRRFKSCIDYVGWRLLTDLEEQQAEKDKKKK